MAEPDELFGLTRAQVERLKRLLTSVETDAPPTLYRGARRDLSPSRVMVGALTSPVTAVSSLLGTPKVGTLNVYTFSSTGTEDTGLDIKVYNFSPQAATTDRWTVVERDNISGNWIITTQFCS